MQMPWIHPSKECVLQRLVRMVIQFFLIDHQPLLLYICKVWSVQSKDLNWIWWKTELSCLEVSQILKNLEFLDVRPLWNHSKCIRGHHRQILICLLSLVCKFSKYQTTSTMQSRWKFSVKIMSQRTWFSHRGIILQHSKPWSWQWSCHRDQNSIPSHNLTIQQADRDSAKTESLQSIRASESFIITHVYVRCSHHQRKSILLLIQSTANEINDV